MSKQIAIRLPNELVDFIDRYVESGQMSSRAEVVKEAIEWQRRRMMAERDAEILAGAANDSDLDELAEFAAHSPLDGLD